MFGVMGLLMLEELRLERVEQVHMPRTIFMNDI